MSTKKTPTHRLGNNVPVSHLKPPDGLPHWTLDQVHLTFDIKSACDFTTPDVDSMLFESSTLLENPASSARIHDPEHIVGIIDVALRLALADLAPRALSGIKVTERSSFKHLNNICPAMWGPGHIEVF